MCQSMGPCKTCKKRNGGDAPAGCVGPPLRVVLPPAMLVIHSPNRQNYVEGLGEAPEPAQALQGDKNTRQKPRPSSYRSRASTADSPLSGRLVRLKLSSR